MNWITLVTIAIIANVLRVYLENYITDVHFKGRHSTGQRLFYGIFYILAAIIMAIIFQPATPLSTFLLFFFSGIFASLAGIPYFRALEYDNSTNLGIFFQFAPVLYLILGSLFFQTPISFFQILSIPIILAAPTIVVLATKKRNRRLRLKTMSLILLSTAIEVVSGLIFAGLHTSDTTFIEKIIPLLLGHGFANSLMVLVYPKWRKRLFTIVKQQKLKVTFPLIICSIINFAKIITYRLALILAPSAALASAASDALSPIAIFFSGVVLTIIWPNFGREQLNKKSVLIHLISTILIALGIVLMQL